MARKTFGIVGYGHFGRFLAESLRAHGPVLVSDTAASPPQVTSAGVTAAPLEQTAQSDVLVLAVPFDALAGVITQVRDHIRPETVVMDVVSTKTQPTALLRDLLAGHENLIAAHPLFGPPSMTSVDGGRLVVTLLQGDRAEDFRDFLRDELHVEIIEVSADQHDHDMAYMQALPFFIARALVELNVLEITKDSRLSIPSFEKLASIASIEQHHSAAMFDTSQRSNPYAKAAREKFLEVLERINAQLESPEPTPASELERL